MYLSHYNLKIEPFSISTDPKFLWLGEKHKEALAALKYGILANKGFLLLTGDVGTGKTTLINALVDSLGKDIITATVHDPGLETLDFLNFIAGAFKLKKNFKSKGEFVSYFSRFLRFSHDNNKKVLLIIDEAQRLSDELLEEIRLLSNIEKQQVKLINIFFVGQNEFNDVLIKKENRALRQRITLIHNLETLNKEETEAYITYRLKVAGSTKNIFSSKAIEEIYSFSGGYPRLINIICDHALLTGFVKEKKAIDSKIIQECAKELRIPIESYERENSLPALRAHGKNSAPKPERRKLSFKTRPVFLLALVTIAAAALIYRVDTHLTNVFIRKVRNYFSGVPMSKKTEFGTQAQPEQEILNNSIRYPISAVSNGDSEAADSNPLLKQMPEEIVPHQQEGTPAADLATAAPVPDTRDLLKKPSVKTGENDPLETKFSIFFNYNSYDLSAGAISELDKILLILNQHPDKTLVIKGYTDNSGKLSYNLQLSEARAMTVRNYFVEKGVKAININTMAMGPGIAMDERGNEMPNQMNRRVEIEIN